MDKKEIENKQLILIPKIEDYIEYMIIVIVKLPRTEKFSIGTEYKNSMYKMLEEVLFLNKISRKRSYENTLNIINKVDAQLNCQRIYLRIMKKNKWIDNKKFDIAIKKIYEIGLIIGGLTKAYAKNN